MPILQDSAETAKIYNKIYELQGKIHELLMEAGLKAYELVKKGQLDHDGLLKISQTISSMDRTIDKALKEVNVGKIHDHINSLPKWRRLLENLIYKLLDSLERREAKRKYDALVLRGEEYLEDAGKMAVNIHNNKEFEAINYKITQIKKEINQFTEMIKERERDGKGGISFIVSIISFGTSFYNFFKKKVAKK